MKYPPRCAKMLPVKYDSSKVYAQNGGNSPRGQYVHSPRIMTSIILNFATAFTACGMFAGMMMKSPA